jgi:hypothetical protein
MLTEYIHRDTFTEGSDLNSTVIQLHFWHLGQVITMTSHNRHYEIQRKLQSFIEFFVIFLKNLKIIEHRKSYVFHLMY